MGGAWGVHGGCLEGAWREHEGVHGGVHGGVNGGVHGGVHGRGLWRGT